MHRGRSDTYCRAMQMPAMSHSVPSRRARAKKPGWWVTALMHELGKNEDDVSHDASVSTSTVYRWQSVKGIDFLDWRGLLSIYGLKSDWKPSKTEDELRAIAAASPRRGRPPAVMADDTPEPAPRPATKAKPRKS